MRWALHLLFVGAVALACNGPARGENQKNLRVGIFLEEPFVMQKGPAYEGFCIDLWEQIIGEEGWTYTYTCLPNAEAVLEHLRAGQLDVGVGPFYITSQRLQKLDFSHPYHESGLQIMVNTNRRHTLAKLWQGLIDGGHLQILFMGGILVLVFTHLLLLVERKTNPQYPKGYFDGFADCFYEVMSVTMSGKITHKGLPGPWGKILAALWLVGGVAIVAYITSTITSVMTANKIRGTVHGIADLAGQPVGVIHGTLSEKAAQKYNFQRVSFPDLPSAAQALTRHHIAAVVFDTFALRYFDRMNPDLPVGEVGPILEKGSVCFVLPQASALRLPMDRAILRFKEEGKIQNLDNKYFEMTGN